MNISKDMDHLHHVKSHVKAKHMNADEAGKFEEELEGEDFGSLDDWETELGLSILKMETKIAANRALGGGVANLPVINMLEKKLVALNSALQFIDENPKLATVTGNSAGGLPGVIAYITRQAVEDAAKAETRRYSNRLIQHLPGYKLSSGLQLPYGGLRGRAAAVRAVPQAPAADSAALFA